MNRYCCYLISVLSACLLTSCLDGKWEAVPEDESNPPKTTIGADILVAIVNSRMLDPEVYREVARGLFDEEDVRVYRRKFILPGTGDSMGYMILVDRHPTYDRSTSILMEIRVDKPELSKPYRLSDASYLVYNISANTKEYRLDTTLSSISFSRLDTMVAAGEFVFRGLSSEDDTAIIRGYFDIPFEE